MITIYNVNDGTPEKCLYSIDAKEKVETGDFSYTFPINMGTSIVIEDTTTINTTDSDINNNVIIEDDEDLEDEIENNDIPDIDTLSPEELKVLVAGMDENSFYQFLEKNDVDIEEEFKGLDSLEDKKAKLISLVDED